MALTWFTVRAVGTILGPPLASTVFMAFAPAVFGAHSVLILAASLGVGFVACYPRQWTVKAALLRCVYICAMLMALAWWTFFAAGMYFPDAWRAMGMGRAGPV
jgi:hypothetical protein